MVGHRKPCPSTTRGARMGQLCNLLAKINRPRADRDSARAPAAAGPAHNGANDYLLSLAPRDQAVMLGRVIGDRCAGKTAFCMGIGESGGIGQNKAPSRDFPQPGRPRQDHVHVRRRLLIGPFFACASLPAPREGRGPCAIIQTALAKEASSCRKSHLLSGWRACSSPRLRRQDLPCP
jgi:hypothetical protein